MKRINASTVRGYSFYGLLAISSRGSSFFSSSSSFFSCCSFFPCFFSSFFFPSFLFSTTGAFSASIFSFFSFLSFKTYSANNSPTPFARILGVNSTGNSLNAFGSFFYFSVKLLGSTYNCFSLQVWMISSRERKRRKESADERRCANNFVVLEGCSNDCNVSRLKVNGGSYEISISSFFFGGIFLYIKLFQNSIVLFLNYIVI